MQSVLIPSPVAIVPSPVAIATLIGQLTAANAADLQSQLTVVILSTENSAIAVDMSQVELLDSAGLMALVSALSLAQRKNKRFSLCAVSAPIRIIFELTQLDRAFEMFETVAAFERAIA